MMFAIGERIKQRRIQLRLTQQQLADMVGLKSRSSINKIEKGVAKVNLGNIFPIVQSLKTTPEYLFYVTDDPEKSFSSGFTLDNINKIISEIGYFPGMIYPETKYGILYVLVDNSGSIEIHDDVSLRKSNNTLWNGDKTLAFEVKLLDAYSKASPRDQALVRQILEIDENGDKIES